MGCVKSKNSVAEHPVVPVLQETGMKNRSLVKENQDNIPSGCLLDKKAREKLSKIPSPPCHKQTVCAQVIRVIDGDTYEVVYQSQEGIVRLKVRLNGVDTPGIHRGELWKIQAGEMVKEEMEKKLNGRTVQLYIKKWGKYGGRIIGDVILDGVRISDYLLEKEMAHPYDGRKEKIPWTEEECSGLSSLNRE